MRFACVTAPTAVQRPLKLCLARNPSAGVIIMLETIAIVLVVLWLLGLVTSYTLGGFIHVLLVIALIVIALRFIGGRSV